MREFRSDAVALLRDLACVPIIKLDATKFNLRPGTTVQVVIMAE